MAALDYSKFDRIVDSDEETGDRDEAQVAAALAGKVARDRLDETRRTAEAAVDAAKAEAAAPELPPAAGGRPPGPTTPNPFDFDLDKALALLEKAEPDVGCSFLEALSKQLFNAPLRKRSAGEAGALSARRRRPSVAVDGLFTRDAQAIVATLKRHPTHAGVQAKGSRAIRHLCFNNPLPCASAESCGRPPASGGR